ncbi:hypothetical protein FVE85_8254 [Porphyridium purpureum]|uniref:Uncharacterized protein n=1 Tax=Porphyridium purpureum TaxID=35688 RepID=A0A5J4YLB0_PORPP|nr:hypothetical protein FVE85_8254 [Porphyridium purpureum]|eukprot:POR9614..scf244_11
MGLGEVAVLGDSTSAMNAENAPPRVVPGKSKSLNGNLAIEAGLRIYHASQAEEARRLREEENLRVQEEAGRLDSNRLSAMTLAIKEKDKTIAETKSLLHRTRTAYLQTLAENQEAAEKNRVLKAELKRIGALLEEADSVKAERDALEEAHNLLLSSRNEISTALEAEKEQLKSDMELAECRNEEMRLAFDHVNGENEQLKFRLQQAESQNEQLTQRLYSAHSIDEQLNFRIEQAERTREEYRVRLELTLREKDELEKTLSVTDAKVEQLTLDLKQQEEVWAAGQAALRAAMQKQARDVENHMREYERSEAQARVMDCSRMNMFKQLEHVKACREELEDKVAAAESELHQIRSFAQSLEETLAETQLAYAQKEAVTHSEMEELRVQCINLEEQLTQLQQREAEQLEQIAEEKRKMEELSARKDELEDQLQELLPKYETAQMNLNKLRAQMDETETKVITSENELLQVKTFAETLETDLAEVRRASQHKDASFLADIQALQDRYDILTDELGLCRQREMEHLDQIEQESHEVHRLRALKEGLEEQLRDLVPRYEGALDNVEDLSMRLQQHEQLGDLERARMEELLSNHAEQVMLLEAEVEELKAERDTFSEERTLRLSSEGAVMKSLEIEIENQRERLRQSDGANEDLKQLLSQVTDDRDGALARCEALSIRLRENEEQYAEMSANYSGVCSQESSMNERMSWLELEIENLREHLKESLDVNEHLKEQLYAMTNERDDAEGRCESLSAALHTKEEESAEISAQCAESHERESLALKQIATLELNFEGMDERLNQSFEENEQLRQLMDQLITDRDEAVEQCEALRAALHANEEQDTEENAKCRECTARESSENERITSLEAEIEELDTHLKHTDETKKKLEQLLLEVTQDRDDLANRCKTLSASLHETKARCDELNTEFLESRAKISSDTERIEALQSEVDLLCSHQTESEQTSEQLALCRDELKAKTDEVAARERELYTSKSDMQALELRLAETKRNLSDKVESVCAEMRALETECQKLREQVRGSKRLFDEQHEQSASVASEKQRPLAPEASFEQGRNDLSLKEEAPKDEECERVSGQTKALRSHGTASPVEPRAKTVHAAVSHGAATLVLNRVSCAAEKLGSEHEIVRTLRQFEQSHVMYVDAAHRALSDITELLNMHEARTAPGAKPRTSHHRKPIQPVRR